MPQQKKSMKIVNSQVNKIFLKTLNTWIVVIKNSIMHALTIGSLTFTTVNKGS